MVSLQTSYEFGNRTPGAAGKADKSRSRGEAHSSTNTQAAAPGKCSRWVGSRADGYRKWTHTVGDEGPPIGRWRSPSAAGGIRCAWANWWSNEWRR